MNWFTKIQDVLTPRNIKVVTSPSVKSAKLVNYALELDKAGRTDEAAAIYWALLEKDSSEIAAAINLCDIWIRQGKLADAMTVLRVIVEKVPDCSAAWCNLSSALSLLGDHEQALNAANEAVKIKPGANQNAMAYYNRAECWWVLNQADLALADYEIAMTLDPQNQEIADKYSLALLALDKNRQPFGDVKHEWKEHGGWTVDGIQVASTLQCPHCDRHFVSVRTAEMHWCHSCGARTCDSPICSSACRPFMRQLEAIERQSQRVL